MIDEAVLAKIKALLEVKGRTPEEAAAYVAKANELAEKHGIAMYEVVASGKSRMAGHVRETAATDVFERGKPEAWRWEVLNAAAKAAGVKVISGWRTELKQSKVTGRTRYATFTTAYFIGLPLDVEVATYTYQYLIQEVERLAKVHADVAWTEIRERAVRWGITVHEAEADYAMSHVHPLKQQASFRKGAAYGVKEALAGLTQERQAASASTTALVVNREAAIRDYIYQKRYGKTYDEYTAEQEARWKAAEAKYAAEHPAAVARKAKPFRWTKRDQQRAEAADRKEQRRLEAEQNRYWRGVDTTSWRTGREAGRAIKVRPAVRGGEAHD